MKFKEMTHQVSCLKTKSNATKCAETLDQARAVPIFFFVCLFTAEGISVPILSQRNVSMARGKKAERHQKPPPKLSLRTKLSNQT